MANKYVLDTHAVVWYLEANPRLGANVKALLDGLDNQFVFPLIAFAEACYIIEKGRTTIPSVSAFVSSIRADSRIQIYPLTWQVRETSLGATNIPEMHDRFIVATAVHLRNMGHDALLATRDKAITDSGIVPVIW